ncbi:transcription factor MYBS3 [Dendrobium catenatum]|uniref:transcription factor MYBS3 n=1 Tax=Dendrobium catenatum TaxID=906689 RepID=UPI0009F4A8D2|nr:transcription factor MYBS3 [Dendrobium catenatum]
MTRRCSHCSNNGHNSRTCPNRGVKLFGVRLTDGSIRKSASMGNLSLFAGSAGGSSPAEGLEASGTAGDGYASEDLVQGSSSSCRERKRGIPWTEEEHRLFLLGLQKLRKGDWRGISRKYVITRTPTQVASHAQKYFIRQSNASRRRRRTSLFDMVPDETAEPELFPMNYKEPETQEHHCTPAPVLQEEECESMDSNNSADEEESDVIKPEISESQGSYQVIYPAYFSPFFPFTLPPWPLSAAETVEKKAHEIVKPTPLHTKSPIKVDELLGMSKLSIGESGVEEAAPSPSLSVNLLIANRHSAFHANYPARPKAAQ